MDGNKHYIRPDINGIVIHGFSDAFEQPQEGDLWLSSQDPGQRHFQIQLTTERMQFKYKVVNGQMVERTQAELDAELAARPPAPKTELEIMKESAAQQSADFQAFMDNYYSKNPE